MHKFLFLSLVFVLPIFAENKGIDDPLLIKAREWIVFDDEQGEKSPDSKSSTTKESEKQEKPSRSGWRETLRDLKRLLIQSDPLGKNRQQGLRPIHLRLVKVNDYKTRLSNTISYVWKDKHQDTRSLSVTYSPLVLKDPFAEMKMDAWDLSLGMRKYFRNHIYFQGNAGYLIYRPNAFYSRYFQVRGTSFQDQSIPYLTLGVGFRVLKSVPILKTPLVARASYTIGNDLHFPIPGPHGYDRIGINGFKVGFSVRLKI